MNIILLSGGSGKRLWPLSNEIRSKQFIKIFKTDEGYESMVQRVYGQIKKIDPEATVTIATSKTQVSAIHNQLGTSVGISVEPCRRDTFPAIALATAYLHDVLGIDKNEVVVVCPVDPYVEDGYFELIQELGTQAKKGEADLILMGIQPIYPSEKYGYIIPKTSEFLSEVSSFKEKPDEKTAEQYIKQGGLWNAGVFAYKLKYVLDITLRLLNTNDYSELYANYTNLIKTSFDYEVVEKAQKIQVIRYLGKWKDIGSWNTLTETMEENIIGNGIMNEKCQNVHILNDLDIPVLAMGLKDVVISASSDGILVADKEQSSHIKVYVDNFVTSARFAEKSWGSYRVLDVGQDSMTVKVTLRTGEKMNYHSHSNRDEVWTVISGNGHTIIDGKEQKVFVGDVIIMRAGCKHTIIAETELKLIEVQLGKDISVHDKQKFELDK